MNRQQDLTINPRDQVFLKIGRNVVHFQQLEATLRLLVLASSVQGGLDKLAATHAQNAKVVGKQPMGKLATSFHKQVYADGLIDNVPTNPSKPWVSIRLKIDIDPKIAKARKRELKTLVTDRNRLIHKDLARFDENSLDSCRNLMARLDEQNDRILNQLNELKSLRKMFTKLRAEFAAVINTDEIAAAFQNEIQDA